jgi:hypothetical protein
MVSSTTAFQKIDTMKHLVVYEFIHTQLNIIEQILFFLELLRLRFSNRLTDINISRNLYQTLHSSFNGAHGRFIVDKVNNRTANSILLEPENTLMMGTLISFSNLAALGLHLSTTLYTPVGGVPTPPQNPNEIFLWDNYNADIAALNVGAALPVPIRDIRNILRSTIDGLFGDAPVGNEPNSIYYTINCMLSKMRYTAIPNTNQILSILGIPGAVGFGALRTTPGGGAAAGNPIVTQNPTLVAPGANKDPLDEETYLNYFIELMEHDVFKLLRKLLLHPHLCECNFFNNRIKLDLSPLEQNLEKQLTNLTQLFNDIKIHINERELVESINTRLTNTFSKYELLFKSNFTPDNIVNNTPVENINNTIQTIERFLNSEITENDFTVAERRDRLSFDDNPAWRTLYINNINRLALKFWNTFFISHPRHYNNATYKSIFNHYRLVNAYGETIQKREVNLNYPLEVLIQTKGPRARDQTLECDNLIFAEPHPETFSTNGLFDFDIISYFNHILSTFLKGCMSENDAKIYKLCAEYINYTQDNLDNFIDNRYVNIQNITYMDSGLNYADTLANGIPYANALGMGVAALPNGRNQNTLCNIFNPYLVSHKTLFEKHQNSNVIFSINNYEGPPAGAAAGGLTEPEKESMNYFPYISYIVANPFVFNGVNASRSEVINNQFMLTRFLKRITIRSNTIRYNENNNQLLSVIDEPLNRLRRSTMANIPVANGGYAAPAGGVSNTSVNRNQNTLSIFNNQNHTNLGLLAQTGGLTLHGLNGEFYRNIDITLPVVAGGAGDNAFLAGMAAAAPGFLSAHSFPIDLYVVNNLLNFNNSGDFTDITNNTRNLFNKNNFMDINYLGVQFRNQNNNQNNNNNNAVLLRSNALVLKHLLTNFNTVSDNKLHLYDNIAEIPQNIKDSMLGVCNYTKYEINILLKLIQTLNRVRNYTEINSTNNNEQVTMQHRAICNNIFNHINALNKQIDIILLELNDEKFNYGETSLDNFESIKSLTNAEPNVSITSCLYNYLNDFKQIPVFNNNDISFIPGNNQPIIDNQLESLSIAGANDVFSKNMLLFTNSPMLLYNLSTVNDVLGTRAAANFSRFDTDRTIGGPVVNLGRLNFANPLMPNYTNLQRGLFSVRKLYNVNKNKLSLNDFTYLKKIISLYNNSLDIKINENIFNNVLNSMVDLKFNTDDAPLVLTLTAAYRTNNLCNDVNNIDPFNENRFVPAGAPAANSVNTMRRLNNYFNNNVSLLLSVQNINANPNVPLALTRNRYRFEQIPFLLNSDNLKNDEQQYLNQIRAFLERTYPRRMDLNPFNNKDYLIRMNILDLNIMPIDINAMSREIPLAYLFNYASSLDDYLTDMTEGSIIDRQILELRENNANRNENNLVRGFIDNFFTSYSTIPNTNERTNINPNISYMFDRNKKTLLTRNNIINRNINNAFNAHDFDRNMHYNTLLKTVNNIYSSHSAIHIINQNNINNRNMLIDYEHFMENKKYKGNAPHDINMYRLRRIGDDTNDRTQFYAFDLYSGIHKAPPTDNRLAGTYQHNYNLAAGAGGNNINGVFNDIRLALNYPILAAVGAPGVPLPAPPAGAATGFAYNEAGGAAGAADFIIPRNNRVYKDANNNQQLALFPFNNLFGLSALTCGNYLQSITVLNNLDMIEFLHNTFQQRFWNNNNNVYRNENSLAASNVNNPILGYFADDRNKYAHHDLNISYLNRFKVNHIGNLLNPVTAAAAAAVVAAAAPAARAAVAAAQPHALTKPTLDRLAGNNARSIESIYELFGRYDIRYIPNNLLESNEQRRLARFAHVMSRFLYSDNGFSFTFTRHVYFINLAFNLIRHKIKAESLYNTNKVIQGKLYYQDDYDSYDQIMPFQETLLRQLPRNPLNNGQYQTARPNFPTINF